MSDELKKFQQALRARIHHKGPVEEPLPQGRSISHEELRDRRSPGPIPQLGADGPQQLNQYGRIEEPSALPSGGSVVAEDPNAPAPGVLRRLKKAIMPMPLEGGSNISPQQAQAVVAELARRDPRLFRELMKGLGKMKNPQAEAEGL